MQPTDSPVTDQTVTPARTLRAAAYYLSRHGWVQGSYYDGSATVFTPAACLVGAIAMVCYGGPVEAPAQHFDTPEWVDFEAAFAVLDEHTMRVYGMDAYSYNDAPGRSVTDVLTDLHTAANTWDHRHSLVEVAG
jgi:hypothetical protein